MTGARTRDRAARRWPAAARMLLSVGVLLFLLSRIDLRALLALWRGLSPPLLVLALGLQTGGVLISAAKWWWLLRARGQPAPFGWTVRAYFVGQFFNSFLPTMIGGDAVRIYQLRARTGDTALAFASVWVERLTGFLALVVIGWIALGLSRQVLLGAPAALWAALIGLLGATALLLLATAAPALARPAGRLPLPNIADWRGKLRHTGAMVAAYRAHPRALSVAIALSFIYQLSWITTNSVAARALRLDLPFGLVALAVPISDIIGLAPIFFNSLGAREGTYLALLRPAGVPAAGALALALLIFVVRLAVSLIGGLLYLLGGIHGDAPPDLTA